MFGLVLCLQNVPGNRMIDPGCNGWNGYQSAFPGLVSAYKVEVGCVGVSGIQKLTSPIWWPKTESQCIFPKFLYVIPWLFLISLFLVSIRWEL